jgi:hypothetical protein
LKTNLPTTFAFSFVVSFASLQAAPEPLGTAFTYQGQLNASGAPANGHFDFQFALFDAATNGNQVGSTITNLEVGVTNGLFTTALDFGGDIFTGNSSWLSLSVRSNGSSGAFTELTPLEPLTPTPNALYLAAAGTALNFSGFTIQ